MKAVALARYLPLSDPGRSSISSSGARRPGGARSPRPRRGGLGESGRHDGPPREGVGGGEPAPRPRGGTRRASSRRRGRRRPGSGRGTRCSTPGRSGRPGSNARLQLVDERIVGKKPAKLSIARGGGDAAHVRHRVGGPAGSAPDRSGEGQGPLPPRHRRRGRRRLDRGAARGALGAHRHRHRLASGDGGVVPEPRRRPCRRPPQAAPGGSWPPSASRRSTSSRTSATPTSTGRRWRR